MRLRTPIIIFGIALTAICLYQLYFTYSSYREDKKRKELAATDSTKYQDYISKRENIVRYTNLKEKELGLGLDLRGGIHVILEVGVEPLLKGLSNNSTDSTFLAALKKAHVKELTSQENFIDLFAESFHEIDPNAKLSTLFSTQSNGLTYKSTDTEVSDYLKGEIESAIDNSYLILRTRIDRFGVTQPNVHLDKGTGRIVVELPGVSEPDRVRKILQTTAKLEFWRTYDFQDLKNVLEEANKILSGETSDSTSVSTQDSLQKTENESTAVILDKEKEEAEKFKQQNALFSVLPGPPPDPTTGKQSGPAAGYSFKEDTAKVNKMLSEPRIKALFPRDIRLLWTAKPFDEDPLKDRFALVAIKTFGKPAPLTGEVITDAKKDFDPISHDPEVNMSMNTYGTKVWKTLTEEYLHKSIAVVMDNLVYTYPNVNDVISGGSSTISGNFTIEEASDLANVLKSGKLPAPVHIVEEQVIGPSLGKEAIAQGFNSFLIALGAIVLAMMLYYSASGAIANIALLANMFFLLGILSSLGASLTLPGIAGIVLTIGMSVDANVLIYERMREEMLHGKSFKAAISAGYRNALPSILDSNITTLLTGLILYNFGSGPIKGFATTLVIGILCSLFTAIFITRLIFDWYANKYSDRIIPIGNSVTMKLFRGANFNFIGNRKIAYIFSGIIIAIGIFSMFTRKFSLGVDFKGGREYYVKFDKPISASDVRSKIAPYLLGYPEVKTFGAPNQLLIRTDYLIDSKDENASKQVEDAIVKGLTEKYTDNKAQILSTQAVGPTIARDIKRSAVWVTILSLIVIGVYILIRFRKWQYSVGATVALAHDVLITLGAFSLLWGRVPFALQVDQHFIAAILTIIGYSINDTVVVFDRLREFMREHKAVGMEQNINDAINNTLSRTVMTSTLTLLAVLAMFFLGGETLRGLNFALIIGIFFGTYSSIFIASPIVVDLLKKKMASIPASQQTKVS